MEVIQVNSAPSLQHPIMQRGITSKESARRWGERAKVEKVYWFEKKEQVYAEKPLPPSEPQTTDTECVTR